VLLSSRNGSSFTTEASTLPREVLETVRDAVSSKGIRTAASESSFLLAAELLLALTLTTLFISSMIVAAAASDTAGGFDKDIARMWMVLA